MDRFVILDRERYFSPLRVYMAFCQNKLIALNENNIVFARLQNTIIAVSIPKYDCSLYFKKQILPQDLQNLLKGRGYHLSVIQKINFMY